MPYSHTRRRLLSTVALGGAAIVLPALRAIAAEPPPEVTTIRIPKFPGICLAPEHVGQELLRAEGFSDIRYVDPGPSVELSAKVGRDEADFTMEFAARAIQTIDAGGAITVIGGVHVGCYEIFARKEIRSIGDLKGKTVGVRALGDGQRAFLVAMATHVGLDPNHDIKWITNSSGSDPLELFAEGKIDAFLGTPPEPQELRARGIGHVIFNSIIDQPWSNYFCCVVAGNRDFVSKYPAATKRVYRAILKAADLCATDPVRAARLLVDGGFTARYDYALQSVKEVQYGKWRDYDPEDTMRYYALRLHEGGLIKSTPQRIIAEGTDWRFLNELKRELKA
jgi:NitT/TauT family transport system substrate-binding protein